MLKKVQWAEMDILLYYALIECVSLCSVVVVWQIRLPDHKSHTFTQKWQFYAKSSTKLFIISRTAFGTRS